MLISPQDPTNDWLSHFFSPAALKAGSYVIDTTEAKVKLDQNENPHDWSLDLKDKILQSMRTTAWNRYPNAFADELTSLIAVHTGVQASSILTGPGSNYLIAQIITAIARNIAGDVVIAQPSF